MPKVKKDIPLKKLKQCVKCQKNKVATTSSYYSSFSSIHADKLLPICKQCIQDMVKIEDEVTFKNMLRMADKPFIPYLFESAKTKSSPIGEYFKLINAKDFRYKTWQDSIDNFDKNEQVKPVNYVENDDIDFGFTVTKEMLIRWGNNYEIEDIIKLEDFYHKMMESNKIETPQDETYLKKLAVISLKMDKELEQGHYQQVKQLGDLFSKYMADSKFRAMDQNDASKNGGLRTFSQIYAEVEKDEFIPPWEQYRQLKGIDQDLVDKTIMYILNYTLKLNKMSQLTEPPSDTPKIEEELEE